MTIGRDRAEVPAIKKMLCLDQLTLIICVASVCLARIAVHWVCGRLCLCEI